MKVTYYGHSSFLITLKGKHLVFDPFISPNEKAQDIDVSQIPADYVLITHGHQDHMADAADILQRTGAQLISNFEIVNWFGNNGIDNAHPINHGGKINTDFGSVKYVNAIHTSSFPDGSYAGNPGGFIIASDEGNFYYSGDTALTYDMKLIGEYHSLDVAFLCIGDNFTMGVEDAVIAADFIQCDQIIGMHYDTFGYIEIDHEAAIKAFSEKGKKLILMEIGSEMQL